VPSEAGPYPDLGGGETRLWRTQSMTSTTLQKSAARPEKKKKILDVLESATRGLRRM